MSLYREQGLHFDYLCMGLGTANSKYWIISACRRPEKDVVITLAPAPWIKTVTALADERFHFSSPGRGILFTSPVGRERAGAPGAV